MKILKLICIAALSFNFQAKAAVKNVPAQYATIQAAINAASNSDTVLVQPGTYYENISFRGKNIVLTSKFYQSNDYSIIQTTIINGSTPAFPDTASCIVISRHEDSTAVVQGFTITGGKGTKWTDEHGAGVFREGGGILVAYSNPTIQNNIITNNHCVLDLTVVSTGGGGMRIGDCYCRVFNNIVSGNSARYGAGIVLNYSGGEYRNNVVCKNFGAQEFGAGAGFWINSNYSRPRIIENNTIVSNSALSGIPGILGFVGVQGILRNNIVWGNTSPTTGQIAGNSLTVRYCNVQGGFNGAGNINVDPQFDSANYYLRSSSFCIDKGDSSVIYNDPVDSGNPSMAKWPSRGTIRNDIGAYGGPGSKVIANNIVKIKSHGINFSPEKFELKQNFPNPFNPATVIEYSINQDSYVSLKVFDVLGNEITTLADGRQTPGVYDVEFSQNSMKSNLPSGIYFYRLSVFTNESKQYADTKKMILTK